MKHFCSDQAFILIICVHVNIVTEWVNMHTNTLITIELLELRDYSVVM